MCGICGIAGLDERSVSQEVLRSMANTIRHRGPDDEGITAMDGAAFGFRRLSIIDLAGGHQPMSNENDDYWIVFNGEIYNFQQLRQELEAKGHHRFKTQCDTEVILHLYEDHGEDCLRYLRGMFAFAIWDKKRKRLFAARDRFGKKPFNYFISEQREFVFASELKALRQHPRCPREIDAQSIYLFLNLQYIPAPRTIYRNVFKLPAAHFLTWSREKGLTVQRYWDLSYEPKVALKYDEAKERLREMLSEAVKLRMIADVPLGAYLSGGIDSSIIVALMAQQSSRPIKTFSIGFEEAAYSEVAYARQVAERYKTDHHEFIVRPHLIDILPKLAWYYSEPFADSSALPSYYLAKETRQHVTVALTGDGGDEMFAGYLRYRAMWGMQFWNVLPQALRRGVYKAATKLPRSEAPVGLTWRMERLFMVGSLPQTSQYLRTMDFFHAEEQEQLWEETHLQSFRAAGVGGIQIFEDTLKRRRPEALIDRMLYLDLNHYLPDCLMVKTDVASMANSLEARSPFLDHVLAEEVAHWPVPWKYRPPNFSKRILKDTFANDLPPQIRTRGKQGFGVPIGQWFRGPLKDFLREAILSPRALQRGYFREEALQRFFDEHQSGRKDRSYGLWALLMLELWHREFVDKQDRP
jgi:asparagine synthase (glutamine-hydrolysing)